ncbi:hypothetical protein F2Q68_00011469 [Brassica cretica]|uniref:DUF4219 domain-containing protein n=1 Tax=Brassica cretica TaxID=69181 RepID=A0A8S9KVQ6_BRACR|nr:hypothetical protein F2Q68_00011469 [Brassica cretica]
MENYHELVSSTRVMLDGSNYGLWKSRMRSIIRGIDAMAWKSVTTGCDEEELANFVVFIGITEFVEGETDTDDAQSSADGDDEISYQELCQTVVQIGKENLCLKKEKSWLEDTVINLRKELDDERKKEATFIGIKEFVEGETDTDDDQSSADGDDGISYQELCQTVVQTGKENLCLKKEKSWLEDTVINLRKELDDERKKEASTSDLKKENVRLVVHIENAHWVKELDKILSLRRHDQTSRGLGYTGNLTTRYRSPCKASLVILSAYNWVPSSHKNVVSTDHPESSSASERGRKERYARLILPRTIFGVLQTQFELERKPREKLSSVIPYKKDARLGEIYLKNQEEEREAAKKAQRQAKKKGKTASISMATPPSGPPPSTPRSERTAPSGYVPPRQSPRAAGKFQIIHLGSIQT